MTPEEFNQWLAYHYECYPRVRAFVEQESGTVKQWAKVLCGKCDLKHALKVTGMMRDKELVAPPYTDIPTFVRDEAKLLAYKESAYKRDSEERSTRQHGAVCGLCHGSGGVRVWNDFARKRMRAGWDQATGKFTNWDNVTVCACKCSKGERHRKLCAMFDEEDFCVRVTNDAEAAQALQDFEGMADTVEAEDGVRGREWSF